MRNLLNAFKGADVVQSVDWRWETAVQTKDLAVHKGGKREVVEEICEVVPHLWIAILSQALVVESINLSNLTRLVVTAQNCYPIAVADLKIE